MDRSWMYLAPRSSQTFVNGVQTFLNFAFERACFNGGMIKCPCIHCLNMKYQSRQIVLDHLICSGFRPEYFRWVYHGESTTVASTSTTLNEEDDIFHHEMHEMLNEVFEAEGGSGVEIHENASNYSQETNNGRNKFDNLFKEAEEKLYPNCKYNKLSCVVHLYHLKCLNGWSNKSFTMLLEFLKDLLPEGNLLPKTAQQVKKTMANLGLGYEKIHSCPNGCMLFWDDKEKDEVCSLCGSSRWKVHEATPEHEVSPPKKKASKILRWFPLKPRLQRLFMSSKTSNLMKWHHMERVKDGKLRHPADALVWKDFDEKFPEFASDPRNVRLALATDGFNPFRTMNVAHSIWPVFLIPYNLPPWMVMKQPNFILKGSLKARAYDPSLTIDEIMAQQTKKDDRVDAAQFKKLVTSWFNPEYQSTCDVKRCRSKMKEPHVSGTKSFARLAHEVAKNNNGVYPTRGEMYITTRTRKDGRIVDDKASEVVASLKAISSESSSTPGYLDFTNDDYSKVKGPEKSGYVRLVGRMPATKTKGDTGTSKDSEKINQLTNVVNFMLNVIQEHIPNANMSAILGNMNIQGSSFPNNSLSVNQASSSRSHNNNGK